MPTVLVRARDLIERYPLRAYDAVQLALALSLYQSVINLSGVSFTFISADADLNHASLAEGLSVDNPNAHP